MDVSFDRDEPAATESQDAFYAAWAEELVIRNEFAKLWDAQKRLSGTPGTNV